jgi:hypothetical protein
MWGCENCEIVFASRSKRWRVSSLVERWAARTFTATVRSSRVSRALLDLSHPAGADGRDDLVGPEACTGGERHL